MQVIWLGSGQLTRQVSICDVLVLSTQVKPVESARDLGVITDRQLSLSAHVARAGVRHVARVRPNRAADFGADNFGILYLVLLTYFGLPCTLVAKIVDTPGCGAVV